MEFNGRENVRRLLYLDGYTVPDPKKGAPSSDSIGYSITSSTALRAGLNAMGFDIELAPTADPNYEDPRERRLAWILSNYRTALRRLTHEPPDAIFCFHIFASFPVELRRIVLDLGRSTPIVGYTHGSHWDPTDTFRFVAYPGMELADLANLDVLDRILVVSEYMRATLRQNIGAFNSGLAQRLDAKTEVVGLPLDFERIDACRTDRRFDRTTVVFNHAPVASKNPELFVRVMARMLPGNDDLAVLFTREFGPGAPGGEQVAKLADRFPQQVTLGRNMPLDDYYAALWAADIQVSTATHESLGVSTLEAMYTGNCCILPRLGSYPEICGNHPDVLYDLDEDALEERLCFFLANPDRRRAVAAELQPMTARYRPGTVAAKIARVLHEATEGRSKVAD